MSRTVGIVVPAFRPDVPVLRRYLDMLDAVVDPTVIRVELDDPEPAVLTALEDAPAEIHVAETRRGKGAAITDGFEALETDVLAFADADGSTPAESVDSVIGAVLNGEAELAVGSRRHPDADIRSHQTVLRQRLGDGFAWIARRFLDVPLYDYQCGAKAMSRETWQAIRTHLYESGFAWDIEVIAMAGAFDRRIEEVPVAWEDHPESTVATRDAIPELLSALFSARHRARKVAGHPIHTSIATGRDDQPPLVNRYR